MLNSPRRLAVPRPLAGAAATAAVACCLLLGAATPARAQPAATALVSVAITSVNPPYAEPGSAVTVSGTLTNTTSNQLPGLSVQLRSSSIPLSGRGQLEQYADGSLPVDSLVAGAVTRLPGTLAPHETVTWSVRLTPGEVPMGGAFGVYPLAAQARSASLGGLNTSRTFLPFWPNSPALNPATEQVAWIWPLIDQPHQLMCPGLTDNDLASSIGSAGRLGGLLDAGSKYASTAHLTWAIDPALLADVSMMTTQYQVDTTACQGSTHPASAAAAQWLAELRTAIAGQPVFVTPYDDVDAAALVDGTMNADLTRAFTEGRDVAHRLLYRDFSVTTASAATSLTGTVWPADGVANYTDLENLAASDKINTVVLDSSTMPPTSAQNYTPSAQASTLDGVNGMVNVLLSDDTITKVLADGSSPSASPATAFSVAQRYLAETAMIAAERPGLARSIVVAPPRRWDPPAGLADELLSETISAPWLSTASLSELVSARSPSGEVSRQIPTATSDDELGKPLLSAARGLDQQTRALTSIQASSDPSFITALSTAVAAVESSAWRGGGGAAGMALAQQASGYLDGQERKVTIIGADRATLGGLTGEVPVSISNQLDFAVRVGLHATPSGQVKVQEPNRLVTIAPGAQEIVKLQVTAATVGSTTVRLSLVTPQGAPYPVEAKIIVQATHYGDLALVIILAALAVLLATAATRAFRRRARPPRGGGTGQPPGPAAPGSDTGPDQPAASRDQREVTDDYAWAPSQVERR